MEKRLSIHALSVCEKTNEKSRLTCERGFYFQRVIFFFVKSEPFKSRGEKLQLNCMIL